MKRYTQLTDEQQAWARGRALAAMMLDADVLEDAQARPALDRIAQQRARDVLYVEPTDPPLVQIPDPLP